MLMQLTACVQRPCKQHVSDETEQRSRGHLTWNAIPLARTSWAKTSAGYRPWLGVHPTEYCMEVHESTAVLSSGA